MPYLALCLPVTCAQVIVHQNLSSIVLFMSLSQRCFSCYIVTRNCILSHQARGFDVKMQINAFANVIYCEKTNGFM